MTCPELRMSQYGDQHAVNRQYFTASRNHKPHLSFRMFFSQTAGHGPVDTDEKHAVIIPQAKAGDNTTYSLLQLPGFGCGGIGGERLSDI